MKTGEDDDIMPFCMHGNHVTFHMWQISTVLPTEHCLDLHTGSKASFRQHAKVMSNTIQTIDNEANIS